MSGTNNNKSLGSVLCAALFSVVYLPASAQGNSATSTTSVFANPVFILLLFVIIILFIVVIVFAAVLKASAINKAEQEKKNASAMSCSIKVIVTAIILTGLSDNSFAQSTISTPAVTNSFWGLDTSVFFMMTGIIALEMIVAYVLYRFSMQMLGVNKRRLSAAEKVKSTAKKPSFIEKINASRSIEQEADIMLDHNYDGIRELDNDLPPWWRYGFYLTIIFSFVYMIYYHGTHSGKLQLAEYADQLAQAKVEMDEYRKKSVNLVDENNVTVLTDAAAISSGQNIFTANCSACHGRAGEGGVGPNLTDDYWLHKGGIKNIFKTIKYGWPEKGMKAWDQDLGARQIHEVASYIVSIKGTNPPGAKEKQGELYQEQDSDTIPAVQKDSSQIAGLKK